MAHADRWARRHPMCTCPEWYPMITGGPPSPDQTKCAGGTIAHPVITWEDMRRLAEAMGLQGGARHDG